MNEEIPEALKEAWPILRSVMDIETVKMMKELLSDKPDFASVGQAAFFCESLLSRMDKIMEASPKQPTRSARPRLQTMK